MENEWLKRYTSLPILIDILTRKKLSLVDPSKWEDRNDAELLEKYRQSEKVSKLFVLCFSRYKKQTYHHWKTYADGISGCCIEFDKERLLAYCKASKQGKFRWGIVEYKKINEVVGVEIDPNKYPFIKRSAYEWDEEFRILWQGETRENKCEIAIELSSIKRITLSPKIDRAIFDSIEGLLRKELGKSSTTRIIPSTLLESERWIGAFTDR